jgi:hypothetical protein
MVGNMTKPKWVKGEWGVTTADIAKIGGYEARVYDYDGTWWWQVFDKDEFCIVSDGTGTNKTDAKRRAIEEIERLQGLTDGGE